MDQLIHRIDWFWSHSTASLLTLALLSAAKVLYHRRFNYQHSSEVNLEGDDRAVRLRSGSQCCPRTTSGRARSSSWFTLSESV